MDFSTVIDNMHRYDNITYYRHVFAKKCRPDDFGYFCRLWCAGDRDGAVVMNLSFLAIFCGIMLLLSLIPAWR